MWWVPKSYIFTYVHLMNTLPTLSHSASTRRTIATGRASARLYSTLNFDRKRSAVGPKSKAFIVAACGVCPKRVRSEKLNEIVSFEGDRREQCSSMPTGPSWSNSSKEAKESRCLRAPRKGPTASVCQMNCVLATARAYFTHITVYMSINRP